MIHRKCDALFSLKSTKKKKKKKIEKVVAATEMGKSCYYCILVWQATFLSPSPAEPICPAFANSVDPDQLASEKANWSGCALFAVNLYQQFGLSDMIMGTTS